MAEFTFNCPLCALPMNADEQFRGHTIPCPHCNQNIVIPEFSIQAGMQIGGYVMEKMLGVGGMGEVWLAHQTAMSRKVALKLLSPSLTKNSEFVDQFMREVKMTGRLEHPNVITAFDAGVDHGLYYLAIAFVDGEELEDKLEREGRLPEKEALKTALAVAKALNYSWQEAHILHRDVKPANIMIEKTGIVKLMDMGISKSVSESSSITQSGTIVGTPHYISPEQAQAVTDLDFRSDAYSLGATLFHMVTGTVPFDADNPMGVLTKHITEKLPDPRSVYPEMSEACSLLIQILMRKDRDDRQQSWDEVEKDIRLVIKGNLPSSVKKDANPKAAKTRRSGKSFSASRANVQVQKTSRAPLFITLIIALAAAGGGTYYFLQEKAKADAVEQAQKDAKREAIRKKNEMLVSEREARVALAKERSDAWKEFNESRKSLSVPADFERAEAALKAIFAVEESEKKLSYAKQLQVKIEEHKIKRIAEVMNKLNTEAASLARSSFDPKDGIAAIRKLYSDYSGPFSSETSEQRKTMLDKYDEKAGETGSAGSVNKDAVQNVAELVAKGSYAKALKVLQEVSSPELESAVAVVKVLEKPEEFILAGVAELKGSTVKVDGKSFIIDSVRDDNVNGRYVMKLSGRKLYSKKALPVSALPLSTCYTALLKSQPDAANIYVALKLAEAGKVLKAQEYLDKAGESEFVDALKTILE